MRDLAARPELLSLNTATVRARWNLEQIIEGCARHGIRGISPWRDQVAAIGLDRTAKLVRTHGLSLSGYCRGGMFPAADAAGRAKAREDNRRALDEAVTLGAACLVLVVGGLPPGSKDIAGARAQVEEGIGWLLDEARPAGMRIAIEPLHPMYAADRACVNTLAQANAICERLAGPQDGGLGAAGLGVAVDVYHVWWDPSLEAEIARAGKAGRLYAFHVCDWLVPTADLLLDRGMMGDGVIDIPRIRGWVEAAGFAGQVEVEIFSAANWWKRDPDEVLSVVKQRYATVC
ncbi:MAG: sugar phosphate isomerase/epimerase [Rhodospirillaceae bacterium]|nr:sugar phosphate isomerase/epimerase [Rhodospirillaceae bacterium]